MHAILEVAFWCLHRDVQQSSPLVTGENALHKGIVEQQVRIKKNMTVIYKAVYGTVSSGPHLSPSIKEDPLGKCTLSIFSIFTKQTVFKAYWNKRTMRINRHLMIHRLKPDFLLKGEPVFFNPASVSGIFGCTPSKLNWSYAF